MLTQRLELNTRGRGGFAAFTVGCGMPHRNCNLGFLRLCLRIDYVRGLVETLNCQARKGRMTRRFDSAWKKEFQ